MNTLNHQNDEEIILTEVDLFDIPSTLPGTFIGKTKTHLVNGFDEYKINHDIINRKPKLNLNTLERKYLAFIEELNTYVSVTCGATSKDRLKINDFSYRILEEQIDILK